MNEPFNAPEPWILEAVERIFGERAIGWRRPSGGYTPALRLLATFESGKSAFLKCGVHPVHCMAAQRARLLSRDVKRPFMPRFSDGTTPGPPVLALEDLSAAHWPPPWNGTRVAPVLEPSQPSRARRIPLVLRYRSLRP